jgi:hypothetical protein
MDSRPYKRSAIKTKVCNWKDQRPHKISVLHQNVQSLNNKLLEVEVILQSELQYVDVLCFTENWQKNQQIGYTNITQFKLVSSFCRVKSEHGGVCIYVKKKFGNQRDLLPPRYK